MALLDILKMRLWEQWRSIIFANRLFPPTLFRNNRGDHFLFSSGIAPILKGIAASFLFEIQQTRTMSPKRSLFETLDSLLQRFVLLV